MFLAYFYFMYKKILFASCVALAFWSCSEETQNTQPPQNTQPVEAPVRLAPAFNADSAYTFIEKQLSFGFRVTGTKSHKACADWLVKKFKSYGAEVIVQSATISTYDRKTQLPIQNIIASFNPQASKRIIFSAHWDSRPWADEDSVRKTEPIAAANDAGSGVAVLLEMARLFQQKNPTVGVDLMLWDAEDWGKSDQTAESYCLGSQYWGLHPHKANYQAYYGVNLDMVGGAGAQFLQDEGSLQYAGATMQKLWAIGNELGYSNYFSYEKCPGLVDDHLFMNTLGKVPSIDVIDRRKGPDGYGFFEHWHTHQDNIQAISKETLKAVGQSVLEMAYREK